MSAKVEFELDSESKEEEQEQEENKRVEEGGASRDWTPDSYVPEYAYKDIIKFGDSKKRSGWEIMFDCVLRNPKYHMVINYLAKNKKKKKRKRSGLQMRDEKSKSQMTSSPISRSLSRKKALRTMSPRKPVAKSRLSNKTKFSGKTKFLYRGDFGSRNSKRSQSQVKIIEIDKTCLPAYSPMKPIKVQSCLPSESKPCDSEKKLQRSSSLIEPISNEITETNQKCEGNSKTVSKFINGQQIRNKSLSACKNKKQVTLDDNSNHEASGPQIKIGKRKPKRGIKILNPNLNTILSETNKEFHECFMVIYDYLMKTNSKISYRGINKSYKLGSLDDALSIAETIFESNPTKDYCLKDMIHIIKLKINFDHNPSRMKSTANHFVVEVNKLYKYYKSKIQYIEGKERDEIAESPRIKRPWTQKKKLPLQKKYFRKISNLRYSGVEYDLTSILQQNLESLNHEESDININHKDPPSQSKKKKYKRVLSASQVVRKKAPKNIPTLKRSIFKNLKSRQMMKTCSTGF
ncbi:unnamed protein product [Moneuplotes crassus]|uniref:Uncharacterized protein n=1 Tax=Euplotes crassus TaxID=5936 RepID=A0AAD2DA68_EUPCR|nr:unnamed protein product [Moneuplotes crassus]